MVDRKDLTPGTIVLGRNGKIAIVTEIKPNNTKYPIIYSYSVEANGYKGNETDFTAILGIGDLDVWNNTKPAPKPVVTGWDDDFLVPPVLKGIKIGDKIEIKGRRPGSKEVVTYGGYNSRRPKYPVSFTDSKGRSMKATLGLVIGKANTGKRSEKEIMADILNVYCGLSPENLHCDGEISVVQARVKECKLRAQLKDLFKELGREVDEAEAYRYSETA